MRYLLTACALVLTLFLSPVFSAQADNLTVHKLQLNISGNAFELHADSQGHLWVTDYGDYYLKNGELRRYHPNDGTYQVYPVGGNPIDATPDYWGNVWWVDGGRLYRMKADSGAYNYWDITSGGSLYSVAVDYQGRVWTNDEYNGILYRFDPNDSDRVCQYQLDTFNQGYLAVMGNQVWVGDTTASRIYRLDAQMNRLEWWSLPANHYPFDLALDGSGAVWYTNSVGFSGFGGIGRLDPTLSDATEYHLPRGIDTKMLTVVRGKVWYTELSQRTFGRIDPLQVTGNLVPAPYDFRYLEYPLSNCGDASLPAGSDNAYPRNGWTSGDIETFTSLMDADGWKIYQLPPDSRPVGIAMTDMGWLVDNGRQVLARFDAGIPPLGHLKTYIPAVMR